MHRVSFHNLRLGEPQFSSAGPVVRGTIFVLFLVQFALVYARLWQPTLFFGEARWLEGLLLLLTTAALLASLNAQLPGQNVILVGVVIAVLGSLAHMVGAKSGIPFGPFVYTERIGRKLLDTLPWPIPMLWLVGILASRGAARLVLRPWRTTRNYGFWVIGLTVALALLFDLGLEPYATQVQGYWEWQSTKLNLNWYTTPCVNFLGWALVSALILVFVTPSLISKKPVKHPPQYQPLVVWLLVNTLLATSAALHHLWVAFWVTTSGVAAITVLVADGALRRTPEGTSKNVAADVRRL